jgi:hypothetical protein
MKHDIDGAVWRKASYSNGSGNCVEVADLAAGIAVGDTKDPQGPALKFGPDAWTAFVQAIKNDALS